MNKRILWIRNAVFLCIILILGGARLSWAIQIEYVSGVIYAETGTTFNGNYVKSATGWEASGGVSTDDAIFAGTSAYGYGQASGYKINGPLNNDNHARFILHSTAQSAAGDEGIAYETYAIVRSGVNPGDMLKFVLTPGPGEDYGMGVELTAEAVLSGTINSGGLAGYMPGLLSGTAEIDFTFEIYADPSEDAVMSFSHYNTLTSDGRNNTTGRPTLTESVGLPGLLGTKVDNTTFNIGDSIYVYFAQIARASVSGDYQSSASAYAVQSTSIAIHADPTTTPVPEPSTLLLLGITLVGIFGVITLKIGSLSK
ncbi:MAG: PEP-CTERM sorting domain-containing protein [bacterium]